MVGYFQPPGVNEGNGAAIGCTPTVTLHLPVKISDTVVAHHYHILTCVCVCVCPFHFAQTLTNASAMNTTVSQARSASTQRVPLPVSVQRVTARSAQSASVRQTEFTL